MAFASSELCGCDFSPRFAGAFTLRQRMLNFVQNIQYYMMFEVMEPTWHILEKNLKLVSACAWETLKQSLCFIRAADQWSIPQTCLLCSITFVIAAVIFLIPRDTVFLMVLPSFLTHCGAAVLGLVFGCPSCCQGTGSRCTSPPYSFW